MNRILYKFRPIDKYAIDILVNKRLHLASLSTLNDPHEAEMLINESTKGLNIHATPLSLLKLDKRLFHAGFIAKELLNINLCSLSYVWSSNLLWSHYSAGHSGIAIGITLPDLEKTITEIKVVYDNIIPRVDHLPIRKKDVLEALKHKSMEWKYEEEARLVSFDQNRIFIENISINEVILGLRTSKEDIELIKEILSNTDIQIRTTCLKPGYYSLDKSDIYWYNKTK